MANILGIFTAIVLAVAAFVAMKNKEHYETEITNRDTESANLVQSQARLKAGQETLKVLPIERSEVDRQATAKMEEETGLKEESDRLKGEIDTKGGTIASNKVKLDEIREKTAKIGNIRDLAMKMKEMRSELEDLGQSITSNEATLANLTARNTATQAEASRRKEDLDTLSKGDSLASLSTSIRRVYASWGFVTLADGNNAGVVTNSKLDVLRNGEVVAKLLVTAVESRSSSASIIPESISEGVNLRSGDRVVAESKSTSVSPLIPSSN